MMDTLRCACGGTLHRQQVPELDFSRYIGADLCVILQNPPVWVCDRCRGVTLDGEVIDTATRAVVLHIMEAPERLDGSLARLVRRLIGLTQQELAERMGVNRVTVADWERGAKELSAQHDLLLRSIAMALISEPAPEVASTAPRRAPLITSQALVKVLSTVRKGANSLAPASLSPLIIDEALATLRGAG